MQICDLAQTIGIMSNAATKLQLTYQYQKPNFRKVQALHTITRSAQKRTKLNKYGTYAITTLHHLVPHKIITMSSHHPPQCSSQPPPKPHLTTTR